MVFTISACSTLGRDINHIKETFIVQFRKPGEHMILPPKTFWEKAACADQQTPYFMVEQYQVIPVLVRAGDFFSQRMIYSLCTNRRGDEILGNLHTRIYFRGKPIMTDVDSNYAMKPGKWRIDRIIDIPMEAASGVYSIEIEFYSPNLQFIQQENFVVRD
ncbi:MAG: hypothetical protein R6U27_11345 [Desulfobacterales bacterium]